jgi:hypothetical protein
LETIVKPELHRGKIAKAPRILAVRVLTREDLARLKTTERSVVNRVKAFRDSHHRLARLCAAGLRHEEILRITGFSYVRLVTLKSDPAFQELITQYRDKVTEAFVASQDEFFETSTSNMLRAERQIEEHLDRADEVGDLLPVKTLMALTSDRADRFGYSKKTINTNINIDFAKRMERMMAQRGQATVIDANSAIALAPIPQELPPSGEAPKGPEIVAASAGGRRR